MATSSRSNWSSGKFCWTASSLSFHLFYPVYSYANDIYDALLFRFISGCSLGGPVEDVHGAKETLSPNPQIVLHVMFNFLRKLYLAFLWHPAWIIVTLHGFFWLVYRGSVLLWLFKRNINKKIEEEERTSNLQSSQKQSQQPQRSELANWFLVLNKTQIK